MPPAYMNRGYGFCGISPKKSCQQYKERFLSDTRQVYKLQKCSGAEKRGRESLIDGYAFDAIDAVVSVAPPSSFNR